MRIPELDVVVTPVDDCLDPRPTRRTGAEELPRRTLQPVDLAVAAGEQERQGLRRQRGDRMLARMRSHRIGGAVVGDDSGVVEAQPSRRRDDAGAAVPEAVRELVERHVRLDA